MKYYKSEITGSEYSFNDYINHGHGGFKSGFKDLPLNEYPYSIIIK